MDKMVDRSSLCIHIRLRRSEGMVDSSKFSFTSRSFAMPSKKFGNDFFWSQDTYGTHEIASCVITQTAIPLMNDEYLIRASSA